MKLIIVVALSALLFGCLAGDGKGLDENGLPFGDPIGMTPVESPGEDDDPGEDPVGNGLQPTLASLQENVLTPICAQCHAGSNPPAGLRMDSLEYSIENLIGVQATLNPTYQRIAPGDAQNSFLYLKIIGDPVAGNRMPLYLPALPDETIQTFLKWIEAGAPVTSANSNVGKVVTARSENQAKVSFNFNQPMEQSSLNSSQILVDVKDHEQQKVALAADRVSSQWLSDQMLEVTIFAPQEHIAGFEISFNHDFLSSVVSKNGSTLDGDFDGYDGGVYSYAME